MKHHNGVKRINKLDGGKGKARKAHSRAVRRVGGNAEFRALYSELDSETAKIADEIFDICLGTDKGGRRK
jgi:hypothetical protein